MRFSHCRYALALVAVAAGLAWSASAANGDLAPRVTYDINAVKLEYTTGTGALTGRETYSSDLLINLENAGGTAIDTAKVHGGNAFNMYLDFTLMRAGPEQWSATGSLMFTDAVTGSSAVEAQFRSTSVRVSANGAGGQTPTLNIDGVLSCLGANTAVLVNRGDPWTFVGTPGETDPDAPGADGVADRITVPQGRSYDNGFAWVIKVNVGTSSLDALFSTDHKNGNALTGGEVKGSVVPAPAAAVLGLVGLAAVGWYRRRLA